MIPDIPEPHSCDKPFIEAFVHNRGFKLRLFDDLESATSWLIEIPNPLV